MARSKNPSQPNTKNIFEKGILSRNPVLVYAIGICPLIAVAKSAATAAVLALLSAVLLIFLEIFTALIFKKIPKWLRVGVYAITGILLIIPFYMLMSNYMPSIEVSLGIYIPLLAVNSITVQRCEAFAVKHSVKSAFLDALANSIGYAIPLILTGIIREALGSSKIFGHYIDALPHANGFLMPFCGFIILGFVAAFINYMRSTFRIGDEFDTKNSDFIIDKQKNKDFLSNDEDSLQNDISVIPDNIPEAVEANAIAQTPAENNTSEDPTDASANFESSVSRIMHKWSPVGSAEISQEISPTAETNSSNENKKETDVLSESNIHNKTVSEKVSTEESANKEESTAPKKTTRKRTTKKATAPADVNTEAAVAADSSENKNAAADTAAASTDTAESAAPKKTTRKRTTKKSAASADVNTEIVACAESSESNTVSTDTVENSTPKKTTRKRTAKKAAEATVKDEQTDITAQNTVTEETAAPVKKTPRKRTAKKTEVKPEEVKTETSEPAENDAPKKTTRRRTTTKNTEASSTAKESAPKED